MAFALDVPSGQLTASSTEQVETTRIVGRDDPSGRPAASRRYSNIASSRPGAPRTHRAPSLPGSPTRSVLSSLAALRGRALGGPVASRRGISFPFQARGTAAWAPLGVRPEELRPVPLARLRAAM